MYFVYLAECADKTYYCGYTTDLEKRINAHNLGKIGAKYTRARRPIILKYYESFNSLSLALKREHEIKQYTRTKKTQLIKQKSCIINS